MSDFFRFPHTPHLAWLGAGRPRGDKVLAPDEAEALLAGEVVVEEKVDGANVGFSVDARGRVQVQNRGQYLEPGLAHPQFHALWSWLPPREAALAAALGPDRILFGEWCVAAHSVEYDRLPDWFLGFDLYHRSTGTFHDTARRDALIDSLGLHGVPRLAAGRFSHGRLLELMRERSRVGADEMEGIVIRRESGGLTTARAKLVRPEFLQAIGEHWSRGPIRRNRLAVEHPPG